MTAANFSRYPFSKYPMNNITPFSYRDGYTFLEMVQRLRDDFEILRASDNLQNETIVDFVDAMNVTIAELLGQLIGYTIEITGDTYHASMMDGSVFSAYTLDGVDNRLAALQTTLEAFVGGAVDDLTASVNSYVESALTPIRKRYPLHYGAVGDGVTDDTAAIRAFLADGNTLFDGKTYFITGGFQITGNGIALVGNGTTFIVGAPAGLKPTVLHVIGNSCSVSGFNITGVTDSLATFDFRGRGETAMGIYVVGTHAHVFDNSIRNLISTNDSRAIRVDGQGGALIEGNKVYNVDARGSGVPGDGSAVARGIQTYYRGHAIYESSIINNHIEKIQGQGAGCVAVLFYDGVNVPHSRALTTISNNTLTDSDRRYIKIQASQVTVLGNSIEDRNTNAPSAPAPLIDVINGEKIRIIGNSIGESESNNPIQISGTGSVAQLEHIEITSNTIRMPNAADRSGIYAINVRHLYIHNNSIFGGKDAIRVGQITYGSIVGNNIGWGSQPGFAVVVASSCDRMLVANNTDTTAYRDSENQFAVAGELVKESNNVSRIKIV